MTAPPAFVGRERPLTDVVAALSEGRRLVLIEGEAGIGKSRLLQEALTAWPDHRPVLTLNCPPLLNPFPLGPVVDALHRRGIDDLHLSPLGGALRPLFPEWADRLPPDLDPLDDPRQTRHRLFRALIELIERLALSAVIVEDAHWADESTLELLIMLSGAAADPPSVVVTYRATDVPPASPLLALTARASALRPLRVTLPPLDVAATRAVIGSMFDTSEVSEAFARFVHDHTDGIPLALEESLSLLRDRGDIFHRRSGWTRRAVEDLQVPPTVRDSVLERVQRLSPATRRILAAAAVLATSATERQLGDVAGLPPEDARAGVAQALDAGLFGESSPGVFGFRHLLAARAVEESVAISERRHLHLRAAGVLRTERPEPVTRLSRHFREANRPAEWATYAEAAARLALQSGDDRAAVALLLEVVAAEHPPERRAQLAQRLGEAATWGVAALGELGSRVTRALVEVLASDAPTVGRGEIRLLLGRLLLQLGEFDEAAAQIEAAVDELHDRPELAVRAMISLAWPRGRAATAATHLRWLDRASALYADVPAGSERTWLDVDRASVLMMLGDEEGWHEAEAVQATPAESLDGRRQVARLLMNIGHVAIGWGRDREARQALAEAVDQMRATGYHRLINSARLTTGYLDWHAGRWEGLGERVARIAAEEDTLPEAALEARQVGALLALAAGDRDRAEAELRLLVAETGRRALVDAQMTPAASLAGIRLANDDSAEALMIMQPVIDMMVRKRMWLWGSALVPTYVEALIHAGEVAAVRFVHDFAIGLGKRDAPAPAAALLTCRGLLLEQQGQWGRAADAHTAARGIWLELPRPYEAMLSRERQLRCRLAEEGEPAPTLAAFGDLQQQLVDQGARWDADRVARLLRQRGVEVTRAWRGGRRGYGDQLSPRELEVVRLVARGLTNRQAAEVLFLSPRTIDRHLSTAMRKLDVPSRTALALAAAEAGLLPEARRQPR